MSERGRLTEWNDERGFGFIQPLDRDARVFVHVSEFPREQRRPMVTDLLVYDLDRDERGRPRATHVSFMTPAHARTQAPSQSAHVGEVRPAPATVVLPIAGLVAVLLAGLVIAPTIGGILLVGYAAMSVVLFAVYGIDKRAAQLGRFRTEESALHLLSAAGGWPGALVAQHVFRHKTIKQPFQSVFWATVVINFVALGTTLAVSAMSPG